MNYQLVVSELLKDVVERVNALYADGWRPQVGGVAVSMFTSPSGDRLAFYQAMVREPDPR